MTRNPYANINPSASIYSGRNLLGFVIDQPGQCVALDANRALIGVFRNREQARLAILIEPPSRTDGGKL
jgi:hypothetical protein